LIHVLDKTQWIMTGLILEIQTRFIYLFQLYYDEGRIEEGDFHCCL